MEREIRVYATGTHRALPDCIRATVRLAGLKDTYEAAAEEFKDSFEFLLKETKQFVFKTADISINTHYADERDSNNVWRKKFAGFMFSHTLVCEFPFDTSALGAFVFTLGRCKCVDSFGFDYAVTDEDGAYDAAAADAVKKAVKKANVLAAAAGVKLGDIASISFNASPRNIFSPRMCKTNDRAAVMTASVDVAPRELSFSESVEMVWELK